MIYFLFIFYLLLRLYPYFLSSVPLGYDPGLYLYLFHQPSPYPNWLITDFPPGIIILGRLFSFFSRPENFLIPLSFLAAILLFWSFYLFTRKTWGETIALWSIFFLTVSLIQYRFWWYFYLKNIFALSFIFFYLYFFSKKSKLANFVFVPLIVLFHQPTAIFLFLILLLQKNLRGLIFFIVTFCSYYLPTAEDTLTPYLKPAITTVGQTSGTFYTLPQALFLMLPYLPLSLAGIISSFRTKTNSFYLKILLLISLFPIFGLFLSRRFIPFVEIICLIFAAIYLSQSSRLKKIIFASFALVFILIFVFQKSSASINSDELAEIKLLPTNSYVLVTDNEYSSWVFGYSSSYPITPGFGQYDIYWTESEWQHFWSAPKTNDLISLLQKLPQPLYIFQGDKSLIKRNFNYPCFDRFSWHVYRFSCPSYFSSTNSR